MKVRVRAIEKMYYERRDRLPGEEYDMDAREHDAIKILTLLGKIELVKDAPETAAAPEESAPVAVEPEQNYQTTDMQAQSPAQPMTTEEGLTEPRRYRRRDMRTQR